MTALAESKATPMMQQWHACKRQAQDAVLLFRMGDFYEAFYQDAELLAREIDLTLTKRQGIPMSGVPVHTCQSYIDRIVAKGFKVAVAEQMEDPRKTKGIVKREIVRFVTPGTVMDSTLLKDKANNYFVSAVQLGKLFGLAFIDLSTGEFKATEWENAEDLWTEIYRLRPSELLIPEKLKKKHSESLEELVRSLRVEMTVLEDWRFDHQMAHDCLLQKFRVHSLDGYGFKAKIAAQNAAGTLAIYISESLCLPLDHVHSISSYSSTESMQLERSTLQNLELTESLEDRSRRGTLLEILDQTLTPMGARLLSQWIKRPLLEKRAIEARLGAVSELKQNDQLLEKFRDAFSEIRDLERLMMRIHTGYANPRDIVGLKNSLLAARKIKELDGFVSHPHLHELLNSLECLEELVAAINTAIVEEPPLKIGEGGIFREGYSEELDELRSIKTDGKQWLIEYQEKLKKETGIKTLKVGFTKVFGYYIDVSRAQAPLMPAEFTKRQTLTNNERFISPELKEYEDKALHAEENMMRLESELFQAMRELVMAQAEAVYKTAQALASLDVLASFAYQAERQGYVCPEIEESLNLHIEGGRHPVVELLTNERFVVNDTQMDGHNERLLVLTGPNMAGKSTYIRQVALIVIMAQIGSFVPADRALIGLCDRIFTRIGASDNLTRGQSTFMVEMSETANILNHATDRSLVILDEIGRGTSTYDGISIAWSVAEYLLTQEGKKARTLFATHYWELTQLEGRHQGAKNYTVAVRECSDGILFLRKIIPGGTDKSYGIHVAKLAGLPREVVARAQELLTQLEENKESKNSGEIRKKSSKSSPDQEIQLSFL